MADSKTDSAPSSAPTGPEPGASAGALLRAARERQGLHIAALAAAIKVTPRKLEALEQDRWQDLPDVTFARSLAQTVCRSLKIDAQPVLALMPAHAPGTLEPPSNADHAPFRARHGRDEATSGGLPARPLLVAAALLLVAAAVVFWLPVEWQPWLSQERQTSVPLFPPAEAASEPAAEPLAPPVQTSQVPQIPQMPPAAGPVAPGPALAASPPPLAEQSAPTIVAPSPAPPPVPAPVAPTSPPQAAGEALLVVRTQAASWVEVRDADGRVLLSRTVQPGEAIGVDGRLPLRLVVGNVASTQLSFRGQVVDLASRGRDNVARFELP